MTLESPYLKPKRLEDVIAALQFLGQYEDYKLDVTGWRAKLATDPGSVSAEAGDSGPSWSPVFKEHPEFFRTDGDGRVSLVWRRGMAKTCDDKRPALEAETIAKLVETAIRLHLSAVDIQRDSQRAKEVKRLEVRQDRRWRIQLAVSGATAMLAFLGGVLGAWLKASGACQ